MDAEEFLARLALGETVFEAAEVTDAVMVGVQLRRVSLRKAQIIRVRPSSGGFDLGATWREPVFTGVSLRGAHLFAVNLALARLSGLIFVVPTCIGLCFRCSLAGRSVGAVQLLEADLRGANLRGANLQGANLTGADLREADLRQPTWRKPFSGADFRGAIRTDRFAASGPVKGDDAYQPS